MTDDRFGSANHEPDHAQPNNAIHRSPNLASQVYDAICANITNRILRPGERIVLDHIAQSLGVSHTPVREALGRLLQEGLIVRESPNELHVVRLTPEYVHNTYYVRGALEGLAAELATERMTVETLKAVEALIEEIGASVERPNHELFIRNDMTIHETLWDIADNPVLKRELGGLNKHINYIRGYSLRHTGDHLRQGHSEHLKLLESLKSGDAGRTRVAMEQHIRQTSKRIIKFIEFDALKAFGSA